jgi:hypothetical protein
MQKVDLDFKVKEIIENTIVELQAVGLSHRSSLALMMIQSVIRMDDQGLREAEAFINKEARDAADDAEDDGPMY